ncbi:glycosyltransferase [Enterovirga aerilata]|uniref:Glycosyltransferase n=1 Tax=Enterovirga aerilata TaxID=2730920 RepID=A0A849HTQ2_9HYPH|nr:glycosyltransferase [Enterovirga sp. DB1703]NNM70876.1 glycosyltransferase [Enterovirga sp. DB1703]
MIRRVSHSSIIIIIPFYENSELVVPMFRSLREISKEINDVDARVLCINDSPWDNDLISLLEREAGDLSGIVQTQIITNNNNLGFIKSCNIGLEIALRERADALLLNSDAILTSGALLEMRSVSHLDPLTSVVSPRSNNATICNSPYPPSFRSHAKEDAYSAHLAIQQYLPRVTYAPTAVGFCLYIRNRILVEYGFFDPAYGLGYNEENDLIMRANRGGYRAVLANRAYAYHEGSVSFDQLSGGRNSRDEENRKTLLSRYPEYDRSVSRYFKSSEYKAQYLLAGLAPDKLGKLRVLFDCTNMSMSHNGTFEHSKRLISAFAERYGSLYDIHVKCSTDVYYFHQFDLVDRLTLISPDALDERPFAFALRVGQPFSRQHVAEVARSATVAGFLMLDTIAMDCLTLDDPGYWSIWSEMLDCTNIVGFNSSFSRDQFRRRFPFYQIRNEFVSLCSTDVGDYRPATRDKSIDPSGGILLVGNHFSHKHVLQTLEKLNAIENCPPVTVLGIEVPKSLASASFRAGDLDQKVVDRLYAGAFVVLFPSHYEGFGLPIMHALAHEKPVIVRDLPVYREIERHAQGSINIHFCKSTQELAEVAANLPKWKQNPSVENVTHSWFEAAEAIHLAFEDARRSFDFDQLVRRMRRVSILEEALEVQRERDAISEALRRAESRVAENHFAVDGVHTEVSRVPADLESDEVPHRNFPGRRILATFGEFLGRSSRAFLEGALVSRRISLSGEASGEELPAGLKLGLLSRLDGLRPNAHRMIDFGFLLDGAGERRTAYALLCVADALVHGGTVRITISLDASGRTQPTGSEKRTQLELALRNAGFEYSLDIGRELAEYQARKRRSWLAFETAVGTDTEFLEAVYQAALGRSLDEPAEHHLQALRRGADRRIVARRVFSSRERFAILRRALA